MQITNNDSTIDETHLRKNGEDDEIRMNSTGNRKKKEKAVNYLCHGLSVMLICFHVSMFKLPVFFPFVCFLLY